MFRLSLRDTQASGFATEEQSLWVARQPQRGPGSRKNSTRLPADLRVRGTLRRGDCTSSRRACWSSGTEDRVPEINFTVTLPSRKRTSDLAFHGEQEPEPWSFGQRRAMSDSPRRSHPDRHSVRGGTARRRLEASRTGPVYGIACAGRTSLVRQAASAQPSAGDFFASSRPSPTGSSTGTRSSSSPTWRSSSRTARVSSSRTRRVGHPVVPERVVEGHHAAGPQQPQRLGQVRGVLGLVAVDEDDVVERRR